MHQFPCKPKQKHNTDVGTELFKQTEIELEKKYTAMFQSNKKISIF